MTRTRKRDRVKTWVLTGLRHIKGRLESTWARRQQNRTPTATSGRPGSPATPSIPTFLEAETANLSAWRHLALRVKDLGTHTTGTLHAGLVRSELELTRTLESLSIPPSLDSEQATWKPFRDATSTLWITLNARLIQKWQALMAVIHQVWSTAGEQQSSSPWTSALEHCTRVVNQAWMDGWKELQALFDVLGQETCAGWREVIVRSVPASVTLSEPGLVRINAELEGAFRRAQGDLWGVWSTQAALLRDSSRRVMEKQHSILDIYNGILNKIDENLCAALENISHDLSQTWTHVLSILSHQLHLAAFQPEAV